MATSYKGLTVQFKGETTQLQKALREIQTSAKQTNSELKEIDKALKIDPGNTELLAQKQGALNRALGECRDKADAYRSALDGLKRAEREQGNLTEEQSRQYESIRRAMIQNDDAMDRYAQALDDVQRELNETGDAAKRASDDLDGTATRAGDAAQKLRDTGAKIATVGAGLTAAVTVPIVAAGKQAIDYASDTQEALNKVEVAFGDNAAGIEAWSHTTLDSYGIARGTALDMAALFGDMATGMGFSQERAAQMAQALTGLAGDVASFKNIDLDQAQNTLKGVFTGETESLKNIGVVMTQDILKAFAESRGVVYDELDQVGLVELRYAYVTQALANSQGDFAATSDGWANSMRVFQESLKELGAAFGEELIPVLTPFIKELTNMIRGFGELDDGTKRVIIGVAGFAAIAGPVLTILGGITSGIGALMGAAGSLSAAGGIGGLMGIGGASAGLAGLGGLLTTALPVALGVAGAAAVGFGLAWLITTEDGQKAWQGFCDFIGGAFDGVVKFITGLWDGFIQGIRDAWSWISDQFTNNDLVPHSAPVGLSGSVPAMASGGLVTGATLALIGERGAEYVEPKTDLVRDMAAALRMANPQAGGVVFNVTVAGEGKSARQQGEEIARSAASVLRQMGGAYGVAF